MTKSSPEVVWLLKGPNRGICRRKLQREAKLTEWSIATLRPGRWHSAGSWML
jgi:hypothetical protein